MAYVPKSKRLKNEKWPRPTKFTDMIRVELDRKNDTRDSAVQLLDDIASQIAKTPKSTRFNIKVDITEKFTP